MKLQIREMDWYKRRVPIKEAKPIEVKVEDLQLVNNYTCTLYATYDDGSVYELTGRVCRNDVKNTWTVHGIDSKGHSVLCDILT